MGNEKEKTETFIVRLNVNYAFALEMTDDQGSYHGILKNHLPKKAEAESILDRYCFGIYRLKAKSRQEVRQMVGKAWAEIFPFHPESFSLFITPDTGDDHARLMTSIYRAYEGFEPYQKMITELTDAISQLRDRGGLEAVRYQNYLVAIDQGCGFSTMLSSFGDYLHRMDVFQEEGEEGREKPRTHHLEYKIANETGGGCHSQDDMIGVLRDDEDKTIYTTVGIDVSYFLDGEKLDELRDFVHRLERFQNKYIFLFRVPFLEKSALDRIEKALDDMMVLRTVVIPPLHDVVLLEHFYDCLRGLGYRYKVGLDQVFFEKVRREKKDGRFYGFKSVEKIAREIVLFKAARDGTGDEEPEDPEDVTAESVEGYLGPEKQEKNGYDALGELIGMETIAGRVREIVASVKLAMGEEKLDRPALHMRFLGAPGTGKTTVARIIGQIFREEGILRKGAFMEYSARSLCAEYVGQTAARTASICREAYGSVLFIDEAYALYQGDDNDRDYGREALTTLISEMENHRDDMVVIMAGYTDDMEHLMKGNAGLRSRMPYALEFVSYTRQQLFEIYMLMVRKHFQYDQGLEDAARDFFLNLSEEYVASREFANARFARNLYERTWSKGALRCSLAGLDRITLTKEDFMSASGEKEFSERLEQKKRIGF